MTLLELLGLPLKSEEVVELIELFDMEILYHIDTLHENEPDSYSTRSTEVPFEFDFDENQVLRTIFFDVGLQEDLDSVSLPRIGAPLYQSISEARAGAQALGASFEMREDVVVRELDLDVSWAKLTFANHSRHYEYSSGGLQKVTLSRIPQHASASEVQST